MKGNSFDIPIKGVREQIQHLKAYASNERLMQTCVDPRFLYVARGTAEYVEWLAWNPGESNTPRLGCRKRIWKTDH